MVYQHQSKSFLVYEFTYSIFREEDTLIKSYDEHEDSVYSVTWSAASAWIFASVSYRGNVIINIVPNEEKYKILL